MTTPTTQIDLSPVQRRLLAALVDTYRSLESPVTAQSLADELDRTPGSLRNQMQSLRALNLVEGIPGAKGGYKPTAAAYEILDRQNLEDPESVVLANGYDRVDTTVDEIDFPNVHSPETCQAEIHFQQSVDHLEIGDPIVVGPTPVSELVVAGEVVAVDGLTDQVIVDVARMEAPLDGGDSAAD